MNSQPPNPNPPSEGSASRVGPQLAVILLAAAVLGLIYNQASPLGLRAPAAAETSPASVGKAQPVVTVPPVAYVNQTLALTLETVTANASAIPQAQLSAPQPALPSFDFPAIGWPQVKGLLASNQIVLVDVRFKASYDLAHIPGAISFPSHDYTKEELLSLAAQYPKSTRLVLYCGSEACGLWRSLAVELVRVGGFTNVAYMPGGFMEYFQAEPAGANTKSP